MKPGEQWRFVMGRVAHTVGRVFDRPTPKYRWDGLSLCDNLMSSERDTRLPPDHNLPACRRCARAKSRGGE